MQKFQIDHLCFEIKCTYLGKYLTFKCLEDYIATI